MLRDLFLRIWSLLSGGRFCIRLWRRDTCVDLTVQRRGKAIDILRALQRIPRLSHLASAGDHVGAGLQIGLDQLTDVMLALTSVDLSNVEVQIDPTVARLRRVPPPEFFIVNYAWDPHAQQLTRKLSHDAEDWGNGWFKSSKAYWRVAQLAAVELPVAVTAGQIVPFLTQQFPKLTEKCASVTCDLAFNPAPVCAFQLRLVGEDSLEIEYRWNGARQQIAALQGTQLVIDSAQVRPGVLPAAVPFANASTGSTVLVGEAIPAFLVDTLPIIEPFTTGELDAIKRTHLLVSEAKLFVALERELCDGIGVVKAKCWFACNRAKVPARDISRQLSKGTRFLRLPSGWVSHKTVQDAGLAPEGRTTTGERIPDIPLNVSEILQRGSRRLRGAWPEVKFPDLAPPQAASGDFAVSHLEWLRSWGLPGGVVGQVGQHQQALLRFLQTFCSGDPSRRTLVVGARKVLDGLVAEGAAAAAARYDGVRKDPEWSATLHGIVLASPRAFEEKPGLTTLRWDIVVVLEADDLIKTGTSKLFASLTSCSRRLTLGIFGTLDFLRRSSQREALREVLGLPASVAYDSHWQQLVRADGQEQPVKPTQAPRTVGKPGLVEFTVVGAEPTGVPVPPRPTRPASFPVEISIASPAGNFVQQARKRVNVAVKQAAFVPFMCYWPTYDAMTAAQQQWYFYLRDRVRQGEYPETDLSYIFVYTYELLNNVGVGDGADGYRQLRALWLGYRERDRYQKLDNYLPDWMADYAVINRCNIDPVQPYVDLIAFDQKVSEPDLVLPHFAEDDKPGLPMRLLSAYSDYRVESSKFYKDGFGKVVEERVPELFEQVDRELRRTRGQSPLQARRPAHTRVVERAAYRSAIYAGNETVTLGTVYPYSEHVPFREFVTAFLKHSENKLRELHGYRSRLRGYALDSEVQQILDGIIAGTAQAAAAATGSKVTIDLGRVRALTEESDAVREMLLADSAEQKPVLYIHPTQSVTCPIARPAGTPDHLLTDLDTVWQVLRRLDSSERHLISVLRQSGWSAAAGRLSAGGMMTETALDHVNAVAHEIMGDLLLISADGQTCVAEDYRDELEFLLDAEQSQAPSSIPSIAGLPDEWSVLAERLDNMQIQVLRALAGNEDPAAVIDEIADQCATMPQDLIDRINEIAFETIGDAIIEPGSVPPRLEDEDHEYVQKLVNSVN